jgi:hypothetical protein
MEGLAPPFRCLLGRFLSSHPSCGTTARSCTRGGPRFLPPYPQSSILFGLDSLALVGPPCRWFFQWWQRRRAWRADRQGPPKSSAVIVYVGLLFISHKFSLVNMILRTGTWHLQLQPHEILTVTRRHTHR